MNEVARIWSYLAAEPLLWLTLTVTVYVVADWIARGLRRHPAANPVLITVGILAPLLYLSDTGYETYFEGAQFIHFLLGPATVALAILLVTNLGAIRKTVVPMGAALVAGSLTAVLSAVLIAMAFDLPRDVIISISPQSTTAPVALGNSETLGGLPTLTVVLVILTGIVGAVTVTPFMNVLRIRDWRARGFAVGVAAHGIGTARAFQVNEIAGVFAGIGMALNAILTSVLVPLVLEIVNQ